MTTRKQIRDAAKVAAAEVYAGVIYTQRSVDARDLNEFMAIYFAGGELSQQVQTAITTGELVIQINKSGTPTDDALDAIIDPVAAAVQSNLQAKLQLAGDNNGIGVFPERFEYGDDNESQFSSVSYVLSVQYTA